MSCASSLADGKIPLLQERDPTFTVGNIRVHFLLGNVVEQRADAYIVPQFPQWYDSDPFGYNYAVKERAKAGFTEFEEYLKASGGSVLELSTRVTSAGGGNSRSLIHVASMDVEGKEYEFYDKKELRASDLSLSEDDFRRYEMLIDRYHSVKSDALDQDRVVDEIKRFLDDRFSAERYRQRAQVAAQALYNSLAAGDSVRHKSIATGPLGVGIYHGMRSTEEMFIANAAAIQAFAIDFPASSITDVAIITFVREKPSTRVKKWFHGQISKLTQDGNFYSFKFEEPSRIRPDAAKWQAARKHFIDVELPKMSQMTVYGRMISGLTSFCRSLIGRDRKDAARLD